jgi:hypothetical protein
MDLATRRTTELEHQEQALRREFAYWRERTKDKGDWRIEKHKSQIEKITSVLETFLDLAQASELPGETIFARNERLFRQLLMAHRLWAYFRGKLALRFVPWLQPDLQCCDEFAWACYKPARDRAQRAGKVAPENLKEPPLLFFTGEATPYAAARQEPFAPEGITRRDVKDFGAAILSLPVPIVGVPWFQVQHLPLAVVIGHEVGHIVMDDLGLEPQVATILENVQDQLNGHHDEWSAWMREVFADLYGALSTGPAFVLGLMNYLLDEPGVIEEERPAPGKWSTYPPRSLRMLLNFELLRQLGFTNPTTEAMVQAWHAAYPDHAMKEYEKELHALVDTLLTSSFEDFGGDNLRQVITFTQANLNRARALAGMMQYGVRLPSDEPFRPLFAAATLLYHQDPAGYDRVNNKKSVVERMQACVPRGVRAAEPAPTPADLQRSQQGEQAAAARLLALSGA